MIPASSRSAQTSKAPPPTFGAFSGNKASLLLEKTNPGIRRSTPDSEALASSDDEIDQNRQNRPVSSSNAPKAARRTSWLNEIPSTNRKSSVTMSAPHDSTSSHPTTPSADQTTWGATASPNLGSSGTWNTSSGSSYPWGTAGIWTSDGRKDPPSRLQEVLPSPSAKSPHNANFPADEFQNQPTGRGNGIDSAIPFSIPLHPTPKTYRSQSYSVGQLDPESINTASTRGAGTFAAGRGRGNGQHSVLQHRSSRNSGLGDLGHDPGMLGRVREVEDDEERENGSDTSQSYSVSQARTIEHLTRENAILRNLTNQNQPDKRFRERTASTTSAVSQFSNSGAPFRNTRIRGVVPEESDLAVDDLDELSEQISRGSREGPVRRYSEHSPTDFDQQLSQIDNRNPENVKRAHWQTSLGFGGIPEPPQSRRHSFADVPTRHGSIGANGESPNTVAPQDPRTYPRDREEGYRTYRDGAQEHSQGDNRESSQFHLNRLEEQKMELEHLHVRDFAALYFSNPEASRRAAEGALAAVHPAYVAPDAYGRSIGLGADLAPQAQPLYIVTFKCCRSDVFYIQEGTGLQVKPGDLVIVEADRGTDLGTVQESNITWDEARQAKERYAEQHYNWLMMFSNQRRTGGPNAVNPNGLSGPNGAPGSAVGGMGPPGQHGVQEPQPGELKPKLIKRLAQNHEIQTLRDKEGNEAKAKRVCQQKVAEHRLNMEILDAEFQMDWKKLTFYYFADAYINFNSLVTDLFKIYKTRIWMSAINPASFVTPAQLSDMAPPFAAPSSTSDRDSPAGRRRQLGLGLSPASASAYGEAVNSLRGLPAAQNSSLRNSYFNPYQALGTGVQQSGVGMSAYPQAMQSAMDPFAAYMNHPYQMLDPNASAYAASQSPTRGNRPSQSPASDWTAGFQGLSLGS